MINEQIPVNCGCGGKAKIDYVLQPDGIYMVNVYCKNCGTKTIPFWAREKDLAIDYAVTTWNKAMSGSTEKSSTVERTAKVEEVEKPNVFKCSECGQYFHRTAWGSPVEYCSRCGARLIWGE